MAKRIYLPLIMIFIACVSDLLGLMARTLEESETNGNGNGNGDTDFIRSSCKTTTYPAVCFNSLSVYASQIKQRPKQLAETALSVSLARAESAKSFVSKLRDTEGITKRQHEAVLDCIEEMGDSVDRLRKSFKEFKRLGEEVGDTETEFEFCVSNVQTWTSAALTDENTCVDGFGGESMDGDLKREIRTHVVDVAQETSNALALINWFASSKNRTEPNRKMAP